MRAREQTINDSRPYGFEGEVKVKLINSLILCLAALAVPALAQDKPADTNMQILLDKVKADKKVVVAGNMDLNEAEAKAFWPIYDAYLHPDRKQDPSRASL